MDRRHMDLISLLLFNKILRLGRCSLSLHWATCPPEPIQAQVLDTIVSRHSRLAPIRVNDMAV